MAAIRLILFIGPIALVSCATAAPVAQFELTELKAEMRALREENARLEKRLDRFELLASVPRASSSSSAPGLNIPEPAPESMPALTVVKLKPRGQAAPKIATGVAIVEPSPEVLESMRAAAEPANQVELDEDVGEAMFEQGVGALKTGNVAGGVIELQKLAAESPRHPRADNAIYFAGLGLMGLNDYEGAARAFDDVIVRYPAGDAVLDSLLKLGECRVRLNRPADAKLVYQKIVSSYPGTTAATAAKAKLTSLTASP